MEGAAAEDAGGSGFRPARPRSGTGGAADRRKSVGSGHHPGATTGLVAIACGIDWQAGDEVLITEGEFPAHFATFAPLADRSHVRLRTVQAHERFLAALYQNLRQSEVTVCLRENAIRVSPHLYTSAADIDRLAAGLTI